MPTKTETTVPKPLAAYVGLLAASLEDARRASRSTAAQVARLPLAAAGQLLSAHRRYDELAEQGDEIIDHVVDLVRQRFGPDAEEGSEWIGDDFATARNRANAAVAATTEVVGRLTGVLNDAAGRAAGTVTPLAGARSGAANGKVERPGEKVENPIADTLAETAETPEDLADTLEDAELDDAAALERAELEYAAELAYPAELEDAEEPQDAALPPTVDTVDLTDAAPVDDAAPKGQPTPPRRLEQFSVPAEIGTEAGSLKTAADLPLADFDQMTGPQLRGRLRTLNRGQLVQLLDYERAHAARAGIVLMLENRLKKLIAAEGSAGG